MMYMDYGNYSPDITFFSDKTIGAGKWIYSSGESRMYSGTLFFMTTFVLPSCISESASSFLLAGLAISELSMMVTA